MTKMSKLRAARIVRMCMKPSEFDSSVVSFDGVDEVGRRHWSVSYSDKDKYCVSEFRGLWQISRIEAFVCCDGWNPNREDVELL